MRLWFLVLLCNCVQPSQPLSTTHEACVAQAEREFFAYGPADPRPYRCVQVPR